MGCTCAASSLCCLGVVYTGEMPHWSRNQHLRGKHPLRVKLETFHTQNHCCVGTVQSSILVDAIKTSKISKISPENQFDRMAELYIFIHAPGEADDENMQYCGMHPLENDPKQTAVRHRAPCNRACRLQKREETGAIIPTCIEPIALVVKWPSLPTFSTRHEPRAGGACPTLRQTHNHFTTAVGLSSKSSFF